MRALRIPLAVLGFASAIGVSKAAVAGEFDARGVFRASAEAVAFEDFIAPSRFVPDDAEPTCLPEAFEVLQAADALEGSSYARVKVKADCQERFELSVPATEASYRATVWIRHGSAGARMLVSYPAETGLGIQVARMSATGRATSDGWIEMATNPFPVDGAALPRVYLRFVDFASAEGVEVDALELVPAGEFIPARTCSGVRDAVCGSEGLCLGGQCRLGGLSVPPLPEGPLKDEMVDALSAKLRIFYGGRKTRLIDLPVALQTIERMRLATSAWEFWNGYATAVRQLHDWHTSVRGAVLEGGVPGRLNACFIEGDADLSAAASPKHPVYKDLLVSHAGSDNVGLKAGDRLVAVDGQHPIAWARGLVDVDWSYHVASDSASFADFAEALGGPQWSGGAILRYARNISVVRCDASAGTCSDTVEVIDVSDMITGGGGPDVACDNRPFYHLQNGGPNATNHYVFSDIFDGPIANTTPEEKIYGMVWDTLYGGGNPNGYVNGKIRSRVSFWKDNARGVILDHRAGSGGTLDAPQYMTELVRPPETFAVVRMPIEIAGFTGPDTAEEGIALFNESRLDSPYNVGHVDHDPNLPVALLLHRDGSASDYLPLGMKGAPKVKLFGPGPTAGAFSTFIEFSYWGSMGFQLASGDTITKDGQAWIGKGVVPDEIVLQTQSDLLAGKDTIHEAALQWVRQELKP